VRRYGAVAVVAFGDPDDATERATVMGIEEEALTTGVGEW